MTEWMKQFEGTKDVAKDLIEGQRRQSLSIATRAIEEAMNHRAETLYRERNISGLEQMEGDWMSEFCETDTTMKALANAKKALEDCKYGN